MITAEEARSRRIKTPVTFDEVMAKIEQVSLYGNIVSSYDFDYRPLADGVADKLRGEPFKFSVSIVAATNWSVSWAGR